MTVTKNLERNIYEVLEGVKDKLVNSLYRARTTSVMNGYDGWKTLMQMYRDSKYEEMKDYITECGRKNSKLVKDSINSLNILIKNSKY